MICFFRVLLLICMTTSLSYAQQDSLLKAPPDSVQNQTVKKKKEKKPILTPYNRNGNSQNWGIRFGAAILPIGNDMALPFLLGVDVGFLKNNSIGIQGFIFYYSGSNDEAHDTAGVARGVGDDHSNFERAILIDYRHYYNFPKLRQKTGICLYTSIIARYGKKSKYEDPLYTRTFVSYKETDYSTALSLGFIYSPPKILSYDFNIGYAYKEADITNVYKEHYRVITDITKPKTFVPRFSLSLYIWLDYGNK